MFAVEARHFAGGLAFDGAFLQVGAFVAGDFSLSNAELCFEFAVFPIELENNESAPANLGFAIKFVDLLSM